jgi:hypothetical protein
MRALVGLLIVIALWPMPSFADEEIGRLFWSPEQRRTLDQQRDSGTRGVTPVGDPGPGLQPSDPSVLLSGVVRRSDGHDVVWINGKRAEQAGPAIRVQRGPDSQNRVRIADADQGTSALLKPGQRWNPVTGKVEECHGCNAPAPAPEPAATAAMAAETPATER